MANWDNARAIAAGLNSGECGLSDGSVPGDWHAAFRSELQEIGTDLPTTWDNWLPTATWTMPDLPFVNVMTGNYWDGGGNPMCEYTCTVYYVRMLDGYTHDTDINNDQYFWPVRYGGDRDRDADGILDSDDNCPTSHNPSQADADTDGRGDDCDSCPDDSLNDTDGDGVCGGIDNCPDVTNPDQIDCDSDGIGDACDPDIIDTDTDGDGVCGTVDNCPDVANLGQADLDGDGIGDACDPDHPCASVDRFLDNGDGTVKDCRTDLIWLQNANCYGRGFYWNTAMSYAADLNSGECGLSDGSVEGDWHLADKEELQGIGTDPPATWQTTVPSVTWTKPGSPFVNVESDSPYWSSTEYNTDDAWRVSMSNGYLYHFLKSRNCYVWPVRSDN
jgi:hypothetical protein